VASFAGIDWASREHAVCVVDDRASVVARFTVAHSAAGMTDLLRRLRKFGERGELRVAIERPSGLLVDTLVEGGIAVVPVRCQNTIGEKPLASSALASLLATGCGPIWPRLPARYGGPP
jgi:Transposase